jgi:hypothetical protein
MRCGNSESELGGGFSKSLVVGHERGDRQVGGAEQVGGGEVDRVE